MVPVKVTATALPFTMQGSYFHCLTAASAVSSRSGCGLSDRFIYLLESWAGKTFMKESPPARLVGVKYDLYSPPDAKYPPVAFPSRGDYNLPMKNGMHAANRSQESP